MPPTLLMLPPQTPRTRAWAERLREAVPGLIVLVADTEADAAHAIGDADAAFGTLPDAVLAKARRLRWLQAPQAAPPAGYYTSGVVHLPDSTALIVGVGGIGSEAARLMAAFGMHVMGVDARRREAPPGVLKLDGPDALDDLLPLADFVVLTVPHAPATEGFMHRARFRRMKRTAFFINIGRGRTTRLDDLVEALRAGEIAGAGLDVFEQEPRTRPVTPAMTGAVMAMSPSRRGTSCCQPTHATVQPCRMRKPFPKSSGARVGHARRRVEHAERDLPAAVRDVEQQPAIAARGIDRLQDVEVGGPLDQAPRVAGRERQIGDPRVHGELGIDGEPQGAGDLLVGAGGAERTSLEDRGALRDVECSDGHGSSPPVAGRA
jgi:phosphoglycerate dehydrogenase-like enzyme